MTEGKSGSAWASYLRFSERHALRGAIDAHDAFLVEAVLVGGADVLDGGVLLGGGLVENHQHGRGLLGDDEIGRASCRKRGCQSVVISVVADPLKKKVKREKHVHRSRY